jgi:putative B3/4 domain protein
MIPGRHRRKVSTDNAHYPLYRHDLVTARQFPDDFSLLLVPISSPMFQNITVAPEFRALVPTFLGAFIEAEVSNSPTSPQLWQEIEAEGHRLCETFTPETLKQQPGIAATRAAYKACGKDPSRYRPAAEQLARRLLQGKDLYSVSTLVDLGNLVSLRSGYATGLLDVAHIDGDLTLGVGREGEPYEGIGRGVLNIAGLPVYRDQVGAAATPTSDSTRTMTSLETHRLLFIINAYDGNHTHTEAAVAYALELLRRYADARNERVVYY